MNCSFRLQQKLITKLEVCTSFESVPWKNLTDANVISQFCQSVGVQHHRWPPSDDILNNDDTPNFDLGVVASFGKLLTKQVISAFPK